MSRSLPILAPTLSEQRFSCRGCTNCCRDIVVHLTMEDRKKLDAQGWPARLDIPPYVRLGRSWVLNQRPDHRCVFLQDDGRCRIHAEFGGASKPVACQLYPFVLLPAEKGWRLSLRFDCPSVAVSRGGGIDDHIPELRQLASRLSRPRQVRDRVEYCKGRAMSEEEIACLIAGFDAWLRNESRTPMRRLCGMTHMMDTLSALQTDKIRGPRFVELVTILFGALDTELADDAGPPPPPTPKQEKLFRQQVFTHCQALRLSDVRAGLIVKAQRMFTQFPHARQFKCLSGVMPPSVVSSREIRTDAIEAIGPADSDAQAIQELLIRYLRAVILTRGFFGSGYYGWTFLSGLQAIIARVAVWGFLARYCAAADDKNYIDRDSAIRALEIISRAAGIAKALGSRTERMRLHYLQMDGGLLRLIHKWSPTK